MASKTSTAGSSTDSSTESDSDNDLSYDPELDICSPLFNPMKALHSNDEKPLKKEPKSEKNDPDENPKSEEKKEQGRSFKKPASAASRISSQKHGLMQKSSGSGEDSNHGKHMSTSNLLKTEISSTDLQRGQKEEAHEIKSEIKYELADKEDKSHHHKKVSRELSDQRQTHKSYRASSTPTINDNRKSSREAGNQRHRSKETFVKSSTSSIREHASHKERPEHNVDQSKNVRSEKRANVKSEIIDDRLSQIRHRQSLPKSEVRDRQRDVEKHEVRHTVLQSDASAHDKSCLSNVGSIKSEQVKTDQGSKRSDREKTRREPHDSTEKSRSVHRKLIHPREQPPPSGSSQQSDSLAFGKSQVQGTSQGNEQATAADREMLNMLDKKNINVFTRMLFTEGPLTVMRKAVEQKLQVRILIRGAVIVKSICKGYIAAFDKYMNMAMFDVDEIYRKPPCHGKVRSRRSHKLKAAQPTLVKEKKEMQKKKSEIEELTQLSSNSSDITAKEKVHREEESQRLDANPGMSGSSQVAELSKSNLKLILKSAGLATPNPTCKSEISSAEQAELDKIQAEKVKEKTKKHAESLEDKLKNNKSIYPELPAALSPFEREALMLGVADENVGIRHMNQLLLRGENIVSVNIVDF